MTMLRRLELDALRSDLAAVNGLLEYATVADDPVGKLQYARRRHELEEQINRIANAPEHAAGVALFFGGGPVIGSRGIIADFAGRSLEKFQEMISKRFAALENGELGRRGPVPMKPSTQMMVTDVARGSFGFVLEEATDNHSLADTQLKQVVGEVSGLVARMASPDEDIFQAAVETVDQRLLIALREFFRSLDEAGATLRIVEDSRDQSLSQTDIARARQRAEAMEIEETESDSVVGELLGLVPMHRRFELKLRDTGDTIYGVVSSDLSQRYVAWLHDPSENPTGKSWRTKLRIREVRGRQGVTRKTYTLLGLLEQV